MTTIDAPTRPIPTPGVHRVTFSEYRAWDAVNWHTLEPFRQTAKHGHYENLRPSNASPSQELGDSFHAAILEPERFAQEYAVMPEFAGHPNSKAHRDAKAEWMSQNTEKAVMAPSDLAELKGMSSAVRTHPVASQLFQAKAWPEIAMAWDDTTTGLRCKGRVDLVTQVPIGVIDLAASNPSAKAVVIVDFKSTRAVGVDGFNRERAKYAYHGQLAYYLDGLNAVRPAPYVPLIVAVQNSAPYDVIVCDCRPLMEEGRKLYRRLLGMYATGQKMRRWPGASDFTVPLNPFPWEVDRLDQTNDGE